MAYVSCSMCGGPGAWEDSETTVFCGKCEEKYQETAWIIQQEQEAAAKAEWFDCEDFGDERSPCLDCGELDKARPDDCAKGANVMSDMDNEVAEMTEKGRNEVQEVLAMATGVTTMLIEELDKNPILVENVKVLCTKYADLVLAIAKPLVDYSKAEELKLCQAKFCTAEAMFSARMGRALDPQELVMLLAACFNRS